MTVIWQAAAHADLARLVRYIADENPLAARHVTRELILAGDSLALFPRRGRPGRAPGTRELVTVVPYVIVYEVDETDTVMILRVWHGAQDRP
ncbi:MAG TPA: type II toxin-antitoxin system RelE/ParE family toxin [Stellaceae bacterium]|nr:type II toxin-antitoxin system RelE/ParE family toxin [Stellaceae bacterium]